MDTTEQGKALPTESAAALQRLKALLRLDPDNHQLVRECVERALQAGDYQFALDGTARLLASFPADERARFDRATALIGQAQYASAVAALRDILRTQPQLIPAQINLGLCHYCMGDYAQALAPLNAAYQAGDRSPDLLRLLVSTCHHLGRMDEGRAIADANPKPAAADSALAGVYALLYLDANATAQAGRWAAKALAANPDCVDGLTVQATVNAARMHTAHAREQYEKVLQLAPGNGRAWVGLGVLALLRRDLTAAKSSLERGLELMPGHVGSWHVLAWAHLTSGDLGAAEQVFRHALDLDRNFAETHGGLASIAALKGDAATAEEGIERALRLDPKCLSAQFARSVLLSRSGGSAGRDLVRQTMRSLSPGDDSLLSRVIEDAARQ